MSIETQQSAPSEETVTPAMIRELVQSNRAQSRSIADLLDINRTLAERVAVMLERPKSGGQKPAAEDPRMQKTLELLTREAEDWHHKHGNRPIAPSTIKAMVLLKEPELGGFVESRWSKVRKAMTAAGIFREFKTGEANTTTAYHVGPKVAGAKQEPAKLRTA